MQPRENELIIILADISGYTEFMVANQLSAIHGQICISTLIEALLRQVDIPLTLQEIEGDAVFLYADHPGDAEAWQRVLVQVGTKLGRFFEVFRESAAAAAESTPCHCAICSNADKLSLKIVVHSGRAVFHNIAGRPQVSGADVILAHRLLKNSVASNQYLLLSETAYQALGAELKLDFVSGRERYDEFGDVVTHVREMDEAFEEARTALYSLDDRALTTRGREYALWPALGQIPAAIEQVRKPATPASWLSRVGYSILVILRAPIEVAVLLFIIPRKLLARKMFYATKKNARPSPSDARLHG